MSETLAGYNFAYLDEQTKRMIRRAILKAVAIPGYQVPFGSREMPLPYGWGTGGIQVTASIIGRSDVLKVIDQGADDTTNAISIRRFFAQRRHLPEPAALGWRQGAAMHQIDVFDQRAGAVEDAVVDIGDQRHRHAQRRQAAQMRVDCRAFVAVGGGAPDLAQQIDRDHPVEARDVTEEGEWMRIGLRRKVAPDALDVAVTIGAAIGGR